MSWWSGTRLVAGREVAVAFRRRSFRIVVGLLLVAGIATVVVPRVVGDDGPERADVAVVGPAPSDLPGALAAAARAAGYTAEVAEAPDAATARAAMAAGDLDVAVVWPAGGSATPTVLAVRDADDDALVGAVAGVVAQVSALARLEAAGLAPDVARDALAPPEVERVARGDAPDEERAVVGYAVALLLYLALIVAGSQVATGVAQEKSARIAESLLISIGAPQLLVGKVVGIGLTSLVALGAVGVPFAASLVVDPPADLPDAALLDLVGGLLWFVLGFAMYACAYAALGALVDRQEEVTGAVTPLTVVLVGSFFVALQAWSSPDTPLSVVASLFPLSAPMVMPMRVATGAASVPEVLLAVVLVAATAGLFVRLGTVVYGRALVRTGRRLTLREVLAG